MGGKKSGLCEEKLLLILLISHSVGLEDILQGLCIRAHTHSHSYGTRSKPRSFCGNLEGQNNDFHHVSLQRESERELVRKKVRERREGALFFPWL